MNSPIWHQEGPALVIAGAGSGKTTVLVERTFKLIEAGIPPNMITNLSFNQKAARQLKERIEGKDPEAAAEVLCATVHSLALQIVRSAAGLLGLEEGFSVASEEESTALLHRIAAERNIRQSSENLSKALGRYNNNPLALPKIAGGLGLSPGAFEGLLADYKEAKEVDRLLDYDDLILLASKALEDPEVEDTFALQRAFMLQIDEYQDISNLLETFISRLACHQNLLAVGDPDQAIYGFRGAEVGHILSFRQRYPTAVVYVLENNYRSGSVILQAAQSLIEKSQHRFSKQLNPTKEGGLISIKGCATDTLEAQYIAEQIASLNPQTIGVLYRTKNQGFLLAKVLRERGLSVEVSGEIGFGERKEIKDVMAYARAAVLEDDTSLLRIINTPARGIGATNKKKIIQRAKNEGISVLAAIERAPAYLSGKALDGSIELKALLRNLKQSASLEELFQGILGGGYLNYLKGDKKRAERMENIERLLEEARKHPGSFEEFLNHNPSDNPAETANIKLLTLHSAKGLEFDTVFIAGVEEGLLPGTEDLEEERRLLYVGMTRAKERLYISYARERLIEGYTKERTLSRFLMDLKAPKPQSPVKQGRPENALIG